MKTATTSPADIPADVEPAEYVRRLDPEFLGATPEGLPDERHGPWMTAIPWQFTTPTPDLVAGLEAERDELTAELASISRDADEALARRDFPKAAELKARAKLIPDRLEMLAVPLMLARNDWHRATSELIQQHEAYFAAVLAHCQQEINKAQARKHDAWAAASHFTFHRHALEDQINANDRRIAQIVQPTTTLYDIIEADYARSNASHESTTVTPVQLDWNHPSSIEARAKAERQQARAGE